jgi:DNA-binding NarL/FixJ family response regulator
MKKLQPISQKTNPTIMIAMTDTLKAELIASMESKKIFKVVSIINDGSSLFEKLETHKPEYLLIDNELPNNAHFGFLKKLSRLNIDTKVILYSNSSNPSYLKAFLSSPAIGFIQQGCTVSEFTSNLKNIFEGKRMIFSRMSDFRQEQKNIHEISNKKFNYDLSVLTQRELDIWELIMESKMEKEIAEALFISPLTVKTHKSNISKKLGLKNKVRLCNIGSISELRIY